MRGSPWRLGHRTLVAKLGDGSTRLGRSSGRRARGFAVQRQARLDATWLGEVDGGPRRGWGLGVSIGRLVGVAGVLGIGSMLDPG